MVKGLTNSARLAGVGACSLLLSASMALALDNRVTISQVGDNNGQAATIVQSGTSNQFSLEQRSRVNVFTGPSAPGTQSGNNNVANVRQNTDIGNAVTGFNQQGNRNSLELLQGGRSQAAISQVGDDGKITLTQYGGGSGSRDNTADLGQAGNLNTMNVVQHGDSHAIVRQAGNSNTMSLNSEQHASAYVSQEGDRNQATLNQARGASLHVEQRN